MIAKESLQLVKRSRPALRHSAFVGTSTSTRTTERGVELATALALRPREAAEEYS
jgi:hypothetical protein